MKHIKTYGDIKARVGQGADRRLMELLCTRMSGVESAYRQAEAIWSADEYGYFCLVEPGDDVTDMSDVGLNPEDRGLIGAIKEIVFWHPDARCWEAVVLYGGDYGMTFFCPDEPWLHPDLRAVLESEAVVEGAAPAGGARAESPF